MANSFSKEERVAFEDICQGFEDALVLSRNISVYRTDDQTMERASDIMWRPMPYIAQSFDGTDMTSNFVDSTQLSVPATLGYSKSSPWNMDTKQLRDKLQEGRLGDAAKQKLASDINVAVNNVAALQGTLVFKKTSAAAGFADIADFEALMNDIGVNQFDRYAALSTRDYNDMADNLAGRGTVQGKVLTAYEKARIGMLANFDTYKLDYAYNLPAATATNVTVNGANQYYTPVATSTASTGETSNVDNRYQTLAITATGTLAAGDCFTIAGVNSVHMITKQDTGQLKTFRVITGGGTGNVVISPPIISGDGGTDAELQYQNVSATPANGAAITFLNTVAKPANIFWQMDGLELLPGRYAVPTDSGAAVMRATTEQGIDLVWQKWYDIKTMKILYRLDTLFGVVCKNPEFVGIALFNQT
jgi:hypothetical protein